MANDDNERVINQIDETDLRDISKSLIRLSERLHGAGTQLEGRVVLQEGVNYVDGNRELSAEDVDNENSRTRVAFRDTLNAMRDFRREYDRWERLTAEYALTQMSYSQRDAARELGVAASTINRWAQHPLKVEDYR